jgi:hypothetical protein
MLTATAYPSYSPKGTIDKYPIKSVFKKFNMILFFALKSRDQSLHEI